jgi:hypothetical protein
MVSSSDKGIKNSLFPPFYSNQKKTPFRVCGRGSFCLFPGELPFRTSGRNNQQADNQR